MFIKKTCRITTLWSLGLLDGFQSGIVGLTFRIPVAFVLVILEQSSPPVVASQLSHDAWITP